MRKWEGRGDTVDGWRREGVGVILAHIEEYGKDGNVGGEVT